MPFTHRLPMPFLFAVGLLGLAASCTEEDKRAHGESTVSLGDPSANYGDERIGFKGGASEQALTVEYEEGDYDLASDPSGEGASYAGDGDGSEFTGNRSPLEPSMADAGADDAGEDAGTNPSAPKAAFADQDEAETTPSLVPENPFQITDTSGTSTFSIDVDTGSYTLARAALRAGHRPDPRSVRIEEFINYFHLHYKQPQGDVPLAAYSELGTCPWNPQRELLMVGIQGQEVELKDQPAANLVFLFDVSGSMNEPNKLPLLKKGFRMLVRQLRAQDRVSIVTYAGHESVALPSTPGNQKETILAALDRLQAGGSTNGEGGIQKAYEIASQNFIKDGNNRVLLATDGDFNVGLSETKQLVNFISEKRKTGVFLSVYGFGDAWDGGNYKDDVGEQLADHGDGIYFYIDSNEEARRAFVQTISGSLLTVAKDVKVQVAFNPEQVRAYRLIGYENRLLANQDFDNDSVDGGELGAGLSVTALFEIIPSTSSEAIPQPIPGSVPEIISEAAGAQASQEDLPLPEGAEIVDVRLRYKKRGEAKSQLLRRACGSEIRRPLPSLKFLFAAGVSEFAMRLRNSQYLGASPAQRLIEQLDKVLSIDVEGAVREIFDLVGLETKMSSSQGE